MNKRALWQKTLVVTLCWLVVLQLLPGAMMGIAAAAEQSILMDFENYTENQTLKNQLSSETVKWQDYSASGNMFQVKSEDSNKFVQYNASSGAGDSNSVAYLHPFGLSPGAIKGSTVSFDLRWDSGAGGGSDAWIIWVRDRNGAATGEPWKLTLKESGELHYAVGATNYAVKKSDGTKLNLIQDSSYHHIVVHTNYVTHQFSLTVNQVPQSFDQAATWMTSPGAPDEFGGFYLTYKPKNVVISMDNLSIQVSDSEANADEMFPITFEDHTGYTSGSSLDGQGAAHTTTWKTDVAGGSPALFTVESGIGNGSGNAMQSALQYNAAFNNKTVTLTPTQNELKLQHSPYVSEVAFGFDLYPDFTLDGNETKLWNIQPSRDTAAPDTGVPTQLLLHSNGVLTYSEGAAQRAAKNIDGTALAAQGGNWTRIEGTINYKTRTYQLQIAGVPQLSGSGSLDIPFKNNQFNANQKPDQFGFFAVQLQSTDAANYKPIRLDNITLNAVEDTFAPGVVVDLSSKVESTDYVTVQWSAPGNDGMVGTADEYDIRYSLTPIDSNNFAAAARLAYAPLPASSGTVQELKVTDLNEATTYYFAMKSKDRAGNWSGLSNILQTSTIGQNELAPASIAATPKSLYLNAGETYQLEAVVSDQFGETLVNYPIHWESSDSSLLTVSQTGEVTAVASAGSVTITLTAGDALANVTVELTAAPVPRIAVWDPDGGNISGENNFRLNAAFKENVINVLSEAQMNVIPLTAEQINNPALFSAQSFDVLVFSDAGVVPYSSIEAVKTFGEQGGVLVGLDTNKVPFLIGIEREQTGWHYYRKTPRFAWETHELMNAFGIAYEWRPAMHDLGVIQEPSDLLKTYLPEAAVMSKVIQDRWIIPTETGKFYPLIRSIRGDNRDTTPQMFISTNGNRRAVISGSGIFTNNDDSALWQHSNKTVIAMVRMAFDLRKGSLVLTPDMELEIARSAPEPLRERLVTGSVEPDHATAKVRFGEFNGSSIELGEPVEAGQTRELVSPVQHNQVPRYLGPGASVQLPVPAIGEGGHYVRIRGAYTDSSAGLKVALNDQVLLNEIFVYANVLHDANGNVISLQKPDEFTRIVYIPDGDWSHQQSTLTISNPGSLPIYFDAIQIEKQLNMPEMIIGMGNGLDNTRIETVGTAKIPVAESQKWSTVRTSLRLQYVKAPGEPNRYDDVYTIIDEALKLNPRPLFIIEGTPEWAAISPERYAEALAAGRPTTTPPDPDKFVEVVKHLASKYKDQAFMWEIWNEADWFQFYRGTPEEYIELFNKLGAAIKEVNPDARIITTGMAKYNQDFMNVLIKNNFTQYADLFSFHPYSEVNAAWENPHGLVEGNLMSKGVNVEIFHDEMGFVWKPGEWFTAQIGNWTEETQADLYNKGLSRLLSNGVSKISLFHAGGDTHHFGVFDETGRARPAYDVFADYARLGLPGSKRLNASVTSVDGEPLRGIYHASAVQEDGTVTMVLNPSEVADSKDIWIKIPIRGNSLKEASMNGLPLAATVKGTSGNYYAQALISLSERSIIVLVPEQKANPSTPDDPTIPKPNEDNEGSGTTDHSAKIQKKGDKWIAESLNSATEIKISAASEAVQSGDHLIVSFPNLASLELDGDQLKELLASIPEEKRSNANIVFHVRSAKEEEQQALQTLVSASSDYERYRHASEAINLEIGIQLTDGSLIQWNKFDRPIPVTIPFKTGMKEELLGVYYLNLESGEWEYVGGEIDEENQTIVVHLPHFSVYAVMEYTRSFKDFSTVHWAQSAVQLLAAKRIVNGSGDHRFEPERVVTRAEFTAMLVRTTGLTHDGSASPFQDIKPADWYASAVSAAYHHGIIQGRTAAKFDPNAPITREEMAVILMRAYEIMNGTVVANNHETGMYKDADNISVWAKDAVSKATQVGLLVGDGEEMFRPTLHTTRAQSAVAIYRFLLAGTDTE